MYTICFYKFLPLLLRFVQMVKISEVGPVAYSRYQKNGLVVKLKASSCLRFKFSLLGNNGILLA